MIEYGNAYIAREARKAGSYSVVAPDGRKFTIDPTAQEMKMSIVKRIIANIESFSGYTEKVVAWGYRDVGDVREFVCLTLKSNVP